jgi:uncharacterized protein YdaU (DUF1376 family)
MHYYQFNIADYRKDTIHLSPIEHYAYRQLLDQYYLSESPIPLDEDKIMRSLCARIADDMQAVRNVLKDFFLHTENGYIHKRCDVEIEAYHAKSKSASESAKARWANKNKPSSTTDMRSHTEGNANHKPLTINQELETNNHKPIKSIEVTTNSEVSNIVSAKNAPKKGTALSEDWVLPKSWGDWALSERPDFTIDQIRKIADSFKDHWLSTANQAKSKRADWLATWRNWVRNQKSSNVLNGFKTKLERINENNEKAFDEFLGNTNEKEIEGEVING